MTLVTRSIDSTLADLWGNIDAVELLEADLATDEGLERVVSACRNDEEFAGAVFSHRYRGPENNAVQIELEVLGPIQIVMETVDKKLGRELSFVFLTSPAARTVIGDAAIGYHLAKASINAAVRFLASRLGSQRVRVNAVSPGAFVEKERSRAYFDQNPQKVRWAVDATPLGRFASPDEIASAVLFLLGRGSSYMTGQVLEIDGGLSVRDFASAG